MLRTIVLALGVIVAGIVEWAFSAWDAPGPVARAGNQTVILIPAHSRTHDIAQTLEGAGLVKYGLLFEAAAHLKGVSSRFKAGEYAIPSTASMATIAGILVEGKSIEMSFGNLSAALAEPDTALRLFGKPAVDGQRRLGVALARDESTDLARAKATRAAQAVDVKL